MSMCPFIPSHYSKPRAVDPQKSLQPKTVHGCVPVKAAHSRFHPLRHILCLLQSQLSGWTDIFFLTCLVCDHSLKVDPWLPEAPCVFYMSSAERDGWQCLSYCIDVEDAPQGWHLACTDFRPCLLAPVWHFSQQLLDSSGCCVGVTGCTNYCKINWCINGWSVPTHRSSTLSLRLCPSTARCSPPSKPSIAFCLIVSCSRWFPPSYCCLPYPRGSEIPQLRGL